MKQESRGDEAASDTFEVLLARSAHLLRAAFLVAAVLSLVLFGSVETWPLTLVAIGFAAVAGLSAAILGEPVATRPIFRLTVVAAAGVVLLVLLQAVSFGGNPLGHRVWTEAAELLGPLGSSISVAPSTSVFALLWVLAPVFAFLAALALHDDDPTALRLLSRLGWIGGAAAVVAILQETLAPDRLLFFEKTAYVGSLTAPFVNRNTAATFYGVAALVLAGLVFADRRARMRGTAGRPATGAIGAVGVLRIGLLVAAIVALMMTNSRGGIAAAAAGFLVLLPILVIRSHRQEPDATWMRRVRPAIALAIVPAVVFVFAGGAMLRQAEVGLHDQRFCMLPALVRTALDTPVLGSGLGTFPEVFAAFREPACGIWGVWYRAHDGYLETAIGLGLPAALVLVAAVVLAGRELFRGVRARVTRRHAPATGLAVLVLVATHALVDFSVQIPGVAIYVAGVLAAALTVGRGRGV